MAEHGYSFLRTAFSPCGKLAQIEYALAAVAGGAPSVGIKAANGVVLATEKKQKPILYDEQSVHKVEAITTHIGLVYSGMGPDYRAQSSKTSSTELSHLPRTHSHSSAGPESNFHDAGIHPVRWCSPIWGFFTYLWLE